MIEGVPPRGEPIAEDDARAAASTVLDHPGADDIEVVIGASASGLTRYAGSVIIQNTARTDVRVYVRAVVSDRVATATTNQLDTDHLRSAADRAAEAARASRPDSDFPGLPSPEEVGRPTSIRRWDEGTASASPESRGRAVGEMVTAAGAENASGMYETSSHAFAVYSSRGVDCYDCYSRCVATCLVDLGESTGWGEGSSHSAGEVDVAAVARRATDKAVRGRSPVDAEPGPCEVVLEPAAVATLIDYLGYAGFGAKSVLEGESFLAAHTGDVVADTSVTIADDAYHARSIGIGFDFEGVPKKRVAVIDAGVATGPVTDLRTAAKLGGASTGHYSGSGEYGPYAANVVMEGGTETFEDLIAAVDDGFLVTRLHYVNYLDRPTALLTGMTRDGLFRIVRGEVAGGVRNFRFAQSVLAALASVQGIGRDLVGFAPEYGSFGSTVAPALRVADWRFASRTTH